MRVFLAALSIELRKALSYRVDFWVEWVGTLVAKTVVAYFLWEAVFFARFGELVSLSSTIDGSQNLTQNLHQSTYSIGGFGFRELVMYTIFAPQISRIARGSEYGFLSAEIYDGTLTRYLLYPTDYFRFKYASQLASSLMSSLQLAVLCLVMKSFGWWQFEFSQVFLAIGYALLAGVLYFWLACCLELVAFWADNIWSLLVLLKFVMGFLGGMVVPLQLLPPVLQGFVFYTPFPYMIASPTQVLLPEVAPPLFSYTDPVYAAWAGLGMIAAWTIICVMSARLIWKRGLYQYTGVGI